MRTLILSFASGAIFLQFFRILPSRIIALSLLLISILLLGISHLYLSKITFAKTCFKIFFAIILGFNFALIYVHFVLSFTLPKELESKPIITIGYISSIPKIEPKRTSFTFDTEKFDGKKVKTKFLISWYKNYATYPKFKTGDKWQFTVRLKRPHGMLNPGGFDQEAHLFQNKIRATGYIVDSRENSCLESKWYKYPINRLREYLGIKIRESISNHKLKNLIVTLVIGEQSGIEQKQWEILRRTGTIHFMVIAGLHISFVAGMMFFIGKSIFRLFPRLTLYMPASYAGAILALLGAAIYSALAGFSIPTQRAVIMIFFIMLGTLLKRNITSWYALLFGLLFVIIINPLAGLNSGFWLSFAAVAIITYALSSRISGNNKLLKYNRLQWSLTFGLMPLTLLLFQQAPLISFFANAFTVPWIGFVVLPLSLLGSLFIFIYEPIAHILLSLAVKALSLSWHLLEWMASFAISSWHHFVFNNWILISSIIGALILLSPSGFPHRFIGCFWILPLLFYFPKRPPANEAWVTVLDVGQGLSSVIQTQNHSLIYDTGPKFGPNSDAGESVVIPFLRQAGIKKVDMLVISHNDEDHSGGARTILESLPIKKVRTSTPGAFTKYNAENCYYGQSWSWDGVDFNFIHPTPNSEFSGNNASCVLKIQTKGNSILLTGDIEKQAEKSILQSDSKTDLPSTVLVAPHHGSKTSSSPKFIKAISPKYVLFTTGYLNKFHFPNKTIVSRYIKNNAILLNTAQKGAITFKFTSKSGMLSPEFYRIKHKKYWHNND